MIKNKVFQIKEYGKFYENENISSPQSDGKNILLDTKTFDYLWNFVLENKTPDDSFDADKFLKMGRENKKRFLQANNYVGLIQTKHNITIEILPKIFNSESEELDVNSTKRIFLKMLHRLKDAPFKKFDLANIKSAKMPLLDIFIKMFTDEVGKLIRRGLKADYISYEENCRFLKGKMIFKEQLRQNFIHKERFYVKYDEFSKAISENKLIKSTLLFLLNKTTSNNLQKIIKEHLLVFVDIDKSDNYETDFSKCKNNRIMKDYELLLNWCKIFLNNKSFTNYKGQNIAFALLFPMEKIFEDYVAYYLKTKIIYNKVLTQRQSYHFVKENNKKKFSLKPDIIAEKKKELFIMDTKWKILSDTNQYNYNITISDLYQTFSYAKIYENQERYKDDFRIEVKLIYPMCSTFKDKIDFRFNDVNSTELYVIPFNLENLDLNEKYFNFNE